MQEIESLHRPLQVERLEQRFLFAGDCAIDSESEPCQSAELVPQSLKTPAIGVSIEEYDAPMNSPAFAVAGLQPNTIGSHSSTAFQNGSYLVAWVDTEFGEDRIFFRLQNENGIPLTDITQLEVVPGGGNIQVATTTGGDDVSILVWNDATEIRMVQVNNVGQVLTTPASLATGSSISEPRLLRTHSGFVLTWIEEHSFNQSIHAQYLDEEFQIAGAPFQVALSATSHVFAQTQLVATNIAHFGVGWSEFDPAGNNVGHFFTKFDEMGTELSPGPITFPHSLFGASPSIAVNEFDELGIAYLEETEQAIEYRLELLSETGIPEEMDVLGTIPLGSPKIDPRLVSTTEGLFVVYAREIDNNIQLIAKPYNLHAFELGPELEISEAGIFDPAAVETLELPDGKFLVSWVGTEVGNTLPVLMNKQVDMGRAELNVDIHLSPYPPDALLLIAGFPPEVGLSHGMSFSPGAWEIPVAEANDLFLSSALPELPALDLHLALVQPEAAIPLAELSFSLGNDGNDLLFAYPGPNFVDGGEGDDVFSLPFPVENYLIVSNLDDDLEIYDLGDPTSFYYLIDVEEISFEEQIYPSSTDDWPHYSHSESIDEDTSLTIPLGLFPYDNLGDVSLAISGIRENVTLTDNTQTFKATAELDFVDVTNWNLDQFTVVPAEHDDSDFTLEFEFFIHNEQGAIDFQHNLTINTTAVADGVNISTNEVAGYAGEEIPLEIEVELIDDDGSESVQLSISGLPSTAILTNGQQISEDTWLLTVSELNDLGIIMEGAVPGDYSFVVNSNTFDGESIEYQTETIDLLILEEEEEEIEFEPEEQLDDYSDYSELGSVILNSEFIENEFEETIEWDEYFEDEWWEADDADSPTEEFMDDIDELSLQSSNQNSATEEFEEHMEFEISEPTESTETSFEDSLEDNWIREGHIDAAISDVPIETKENNTKIRAAIVGSQQGNSQQANPSQKSEIARELTGSSKRRELNVANRDSLLASKPESILEGSADSFKFDRNLKNLSRDTVFVSHHVSAPANFDSDLVWEETDTLEESLLAESEVSDIAIGTAVVVATGYSLAHLTWMLRGGVLATKLMSSMPIWVSFDPLPLLNSGDLPINEDTETLNDLITKA